jgi:predicted acylesterase/phospholipase RssA
MELLSSYSGRLFAALSERTRPLLDAYVDATNMSSAKRRWFTATSILSWVVASFGGNRHGAVSL